MPETRYNISITPSRRGIKGIPVVTEITTGKRHLNIIIACFHIAFQ